MHALVVEDNECTAMLIEDELRDLGFTSIDRASTEEEAIAAVGRRVPDLVTSDGSLLIGTGISAIAKIRAAFPVPVIFVTGDPETARDALPGTPVLEKPFTGAQFVRAVEDALPRGRAC